MAVNEDLSALAPVRRALAITLIGEGRELGPLIGRQGAPHAKQHNSPGLVELAPGRLDHLDVRQDGGVIGRLDETVELVFSLVESLHALAEGRLGFLEDLLEAGALFGGQAEFAPETVVLPPLTALGQGWGGAKRQQRSHGHAAFEDFREFHGDLPHNTTNQ